MKPWEMGLPCAASSPLGLQPLRVSISMSDEGTSKFLPQQKFPKAGVTRKTIHFVSAAAAPTQALQLAPRTTPSISPGDRYLHIVLKNSAPMEAHISSSSGMSDHEKSTEAEKGTYCETCNLPTDARGFATSIASMEHESTIAHMVYVTHSHPPSHLDRSRQGLKYLSAYGWDPDSRQGLGATGKGIIAPIRAKVKNDTVGLGLKIRWNTKLSGTKVERLDAKQVRKKDMEDRRKRERLQEIFYRNDDVESYLGGG